MNPPGESSTMVTALEGNAMARSGRAGPALATAAIGSFLAGTLATVALSLVAPAAARFALRFGPAEYFMLMVLAFTTVSAVLGASALRGFISLLIGLALGLVGIDATSGPVFYPHLTLPTYFRVYIAVCVCHFYYEQTVHTLEHNNRHSKSES